MPELAQNSVERPSCSVVGDASSAIDVEPLPTIAFSSLLDQPASTPAILEISNARLKRPAVE